MLFSICIPSYNRGNRAYDTILKLLSFDLSDNSNEIEVICSNNGSTIKLDGYEKLKKIEDRRFVYHEFEKNMKFHRNMDQVIRMAKGDFCLILSDEDEIYLQNLENYIKFLALHPEIAMLKAATSLVYSDLHTKIYEPGAEAVEAFYMYGNYISGTIYNRSFITNELLNFYRAKYEENAGYLDYIHLFLDAYALLNGRFCSSDMLLVVQGIPEDHFDLDTNSNSSEISIFSSYKRRCEHMEGFVSQIRDLDVDFALKFQLLIRVYDRTAEYIKISKNKYLAAGYLWPEICEYVSSKMKNMIYLSEIPFSDEDITIVDDYIETLLTT